MSSGARAVSVRTTDLAALECHLPRREPRAVIVSLRVVPLCGATAWPMRSPSAVYAKISFTLSRVARLRLGFRYLMVLSMSE